MNSVNYLFYKIKLVNKDRIKNKNKNEKSLYLFIYL
jgi:hypothetical protein